MVSCLNANPDIKVEIGGHTDSIGSSEYNVLLGERRANFVKMYLLKKGVSSSQLVTVSYGEDHPIAENSKNGRDNPAGRRLNRRVELKLLNPV